MITQRQPDTRETALGIVKKTCFLTEEVLMQKAPAHWPLSAWLEKRKGKVF